MKLLICNLMIIFITGCCFSQNHKKSYISGHLGLIGIGGEIREVKNSNQAFSFLYNYNSEFIFFASSTHQSQFDLLYGKQVYTRNQSLSLIYQGGPAIIWGNKRITDDNITEIENYFTPGVAGRLGARMYLFKTVGFGFDILGNLNLKESEAVFLFGIDIKVYDKDNHR